MTAPQTRPQGRCARCAKPIPPRRDARGRPAKFCSGACRAAASRERREREHQAALKQARTRAQRTPAEEVSAATQVVRALTHDLVVGKSFGVSAEHHELIAAIRDFADLMDSQTAQTTPKLNRAQRRAHKRGK